MFNDPHSMCGASQRRLMNVEPTGKPEARHGLPSKFRRIIRGGLFYLTNEKPRPKLTLRPGRVMDENAGAARLDRARFLRSLGCGFESRLPHFLPSSIF